MSICHEEINHIGTKFASNTVLTNPVANCIHNTSLSTVYVIHHANDDIAEPSHGYKKRDSVTRTSINSTVLDMSYTTTAAAAPR